MDKKTILTQPDYWLEMSLPLWRETHMKEQEEFDVKEYLTKTLEIMDRLFWEEKYVDDEDTLQGLQNICYELKQLIGRYK